MTPFFLSLLFVPINTSVLTLHAQELTKADLITLASTTAKDAGLTDSQARHIIQTIECESGFDPNAIGDHGNSYGLVQIHLPSHKITKQQALDPYFAISFIVGHWDEWKMWTCARTLAARGWR